MKKFIIIAVFLLTNTVFAQKTYRTELVNSENATIEISLSANKITLVGHDKNEIVIESTGTKTLEKEKNEYLEEYRKEAEEEAKTDKRAEGLKPLSPSMNDNTGLGLMVEKKGDYVKITAQPFMMSDEYKIMVPNKAKVIINDVHHYNESKYNFFISNLLNELIVSSLNSNFQIEKITGPLVLNTTNGNVEVKYDELKTTKPVSIVTVNGYVDLTLPPTVKADLQLQTIQGKAYTDFDIQKDDKESGVVFPNMGMFMLNGKVNGGGIKININSVNGDIYLRKKKG